MKKIKKIVNIDAPRQCKFLSAQSMTACRFVFTLAVFGCIFTPSLSFAIDIADEETIEEQHRTRFS